MSTDPFPDEVKWVWLDEDGAVAGPVHQAVRAAIGHRVNWKPTPTRRFPATSRGSGKEPVKLVKLLIHTELVEDEETQMLTKYLGQSELQMPGEEE